MRIVIILKKANNFGFDFQFSIDKKISLLYLEAATEKIFNRIDQWRFLESATYGKNKREKLRI